MSEQRDAVQNTECSSPASLGILFICMCVSVFMHVCTHASKCVCISRCCLTLTQYMGVCSISCETGRWTPTAAERLLLIHRAGEMMERLPLKIHKSDSLNEKNH